MPCIRAVTDTEPHAISEVRIHSIHYRIESNWKRNRNRNGKGNMNRNRNLAKTNGQWIAPCCNQESRNLSAFAIPLQMAPNGLSLITWL